MINSTFFTVGVIGTLAVVSPGPDFLIVTRNSLLYSKRVGIATACGIVTGNIWWIAASIIGIAAIISQTVVLFNILKGVGALYLIYLGIRGLLAKKTRSGYVETDDGTNAVRKIRRTMSMKHAFRIGLLTNILNPKCAMFFLSFFSIVITPKTPPALQWAYGGEIMIIAITWFSLLAIVLSGDRIKGCFERFSVWLDRTTGAVLVGIGVKVACYHQK